MSKRTVFTTVTPLPTGISRETVMSTLHDHLEMVDLNPLVQERHPIQPPETATAEEYHCQWYSLTDKVAYLPGGLMSGKVSYNACFHDLENGLQTHCYAPMGLVIKGKWTLGGSLPGEPVGPVELGLGVPLQGLWLREDVDMKCNIMMTGFVKKTLKKAHQALVARILVRTQIVSGSKLNQALTDSPRHSQSPSEFGSLLSVNNSKLGFNPHLYGTQTLPSFKPEENSELYSKSLSSRNSSSSGHPAMVAQHARGSKGINSSIWSQCRTPDLVEPFELIEKSVNEPGPGLPSSRISKPESIISNE
ncbi:hypothetical protein HYALB_00000074 [Hymenoscyphus albidus]|uniref:DUF7053 domain-containing protein n=1 Tax=Hymenoscyphus albidus TaxID=595503 RepID=A0A9N9LIT2_9HELO|nr:hypothetical protein HYALB_00000074 [Hymenoscyphus albidus]